MTWEGKWICVKYIYWHSDAVHLFKITLIYRTLPQELHRKREIPCLFFVHLILKDIISHGVIMKAIFGTKICQLKRVFYTYPLSNVHVELYYWSSFIGPITQALKTFNCTELSCSYRVLQLVLWILGSYCLCI